MPSLSTIPQELCDAVFDHLSLRDTISLANTSRALRRAVLPLLYRTQVLSWRAPDLVEARHPTDTLSKFTWSLQTFLDNPVHATYVRHVIIRIEDSKSSEELTRTKFQPPCKLMDNERLLFRRAIKQLNLAGAKRWREALLLREESDLAALVSLIVAQFPRLRSITTPAKFLTMASSADEPAWLKRIIKHWTSNAPSSIQALTKFTVDGYTGRIPSRSHYRHRMKPYRWLPIFLSYLPCLNELELRGVKLDWRNTDKALVSPLCDYPMPKNITKLQLLQTATPTTVLAHMLEKSPPLKTLTYDIDIPWRRFDWQPLCTGLVLVSSTLTELTVRFKKEVSRSPPLRGNLLRLRTLTPHLTHLNISLALLYGLQPIDAIPLEQVLPPKLQRLSINDDLREFWTLYWRRGLHFLSACSHFLDPAVWKSATPELQELEFVLEEEKIATLLDWGGEQWKDLRRLCEDQGIRFSVSMVEGLEAEVREDLGG